MAKNQGVERPSGVYSARFIPHHALDQITAHHFHGRLVRGAILSSAAVRLSRGVYRPGVEGTLQSDGAKALSRHHDAGHDPNACLWPMAVARVWLPRRVAKRQAGTRLGAGRLPLLDASPAWRFCPRSKTAPPPL